MKAILISIKPKHVANILSRKKTIELRKTFPKCDLPIDVYIYCTKEDSLCCVDQDIYMPKYVSGKDFDIKDFPRLHSGYEGKGKVVAKFTLNKIDEHHVLPTERILPFNWNVEQKLEQLCLTKEEVMAYGNGEDYQAFLWHISNLMIFDKPRELSEFKQPRDSYGKVNWNANEYYYMELTKAPQSWMYVEDRECD